MSELNLEEIEARWDEATEGPWVFQPWSAHPLPSGDYAESILMANASSDGELCRGLFDADGEAIAHARRDVPALIAEVRRLRGQIERVQKMSDDMSEGKAHCLLAYGKEGDYPISYFIEMLNEALGVDGE